MADHECSECGREFDSERGLNIHKSQKHPDDEMEESSEENGAEEMTEGQESGQQKTDGRKKTAERNKNSQKAISISFKQFGAASFTFGLLFGLVVGLTTGAAFLGSSYDIGDQDRVEAASNNQDESNLIALESGEYPYGNLEAGVGQGTVSFGNKTYDIEGEPYIGSPDAEVTMISYEDFECPFCKRYNEGAFPQVRQNYIEAGEARYFYKNLPLRIHPWAEPAAIAGECALNQDPEAFWSFKKGFFSNQNQLGEAFKSDRERFDKSMYKWAEQTGLDVGKFKSCYDNKETLEEVNKDKREAGSNGARATPTIMVNDQKLEGAQPYSRFKTVIESELGR